MTVSGTIDTEDEAAAGWREPAAEANADPAADTPSAGPDSRSPSSARGRPRDEAGDWVPDAEADDWVPGARRSSADSGLERPDADGTPGAAFPDLRLNTPELTDTGPVPAAEPTGLPGPGPAGCATRAADFAAAPVADDRMIHTGNVAAGADLAAPDAVTGVDLPGGLGDADETASAGEAGKAGFLAHALVERPPRPVIPIGLLSSSAAAPAGTGPARTARRVVRQREIAAPDFERLADRVAAVAGYASRAALAWATRRQLGQTSLTGISLALAVCAAAWFSAGSTTGMIRGAAALGVAHLVLVAGRKLAGGPAPALRLEQSPSVAGSGLAAASGRPGNADLWLAMLGGCLAECVAYAGLAVGAAADGWSRMWPLAVGVLGLVAVRNLMTVCSTPPGFGEASGGTVRRLAAAAVTMPAGGRILLVAIVAPVWGARVALLALLDWAIISIGYGLAGRASAAAATAGQRTTGDHAAPARPAGTAGGFGGSSRRAGTAGGFGGSSPKASTPSSLIRLRDDGALARSLGMLVRGSLVPLPPAILGFAAVAALALIGLHGLAGALMIAPAIVMLLAAPGSANLHAGRFDFLVPVLLLGAQILYLGAIGLARGVPGPVVYALTAALLLRYADLAFPGRPVMLAGERAPGKERAERGSALGWEGRMLIAGVAAAMGIATFAYVALAAYLGLLICVKAATSRFALQEDAPRDRPGYGSRRRTPPAP